MKRILWIAVGVVILAALFTALVHAQDKPKDAPKHPIISADLQKKFFKVDDLQQRAQRNLETAQAQKREADANWSSVVAEMTKACGDGFQLQVVGQMFSTSILSCRKGLLLADSL